MSRPDRLGAIIALEQEDDSGAQAVARLSGYCNEIGRRTRVPQQR